MLWQAKDGTTAGSLFPENVRLYNITEFLNRSGPIFLMLHSKGEQSS